MVHEIVEYDMNYHSFLYLLILIVSLHKHIRAYVSIKGFFCFLSQVIMSKCILHPYAYNEFGHELALLNQKISK